MLDQITPLVLTFDEEANIARTLTALSWADDILVVDSGSTDKTLRILAGNPSVRVESRQFDSHSAQWSFGLQDRSIDTDWVLALDADHVLSSELVAELGNLSSTGGAVGYEARFRYVVFGRSLRASLYPNRLVLVRRDRAQFVQDGHTQRLVVDGPVETLKGWVLHDDRKPLTRWFSDQARYAELEARHLLSVPWVNLGLADRLRRTVVVAPFAVLLLCLIGKRGILDGWQGWYYAFQRMVAESLLSISLMDRKLRNDVKRGRNDA